MAGPLSTRRLDVQFPRTRQKHKVRRKGTETMFLCSSFQVHAIVLVISPYTGIEYVPILPTLRRGREKH